MSNATWQLRALTERSFRHRQPISILPWRQVSLDGALPRDSSSCSGFNFLNHHLYPTPCCGKSFVGPALQIKGELVNTTNLTLGKLSSLFRTGSQTSSSMQLRNLTASSLPAFPFLTESAVLRAPRALQGGIQRRPPFLPSPQLQTQRRAIMRSNTEAQPSARSALSEFNLSTASDGRLRLATYMPPSSQQHTVGIVRDGRLWPLQRCVSEGTSESFPTHFWSDMSLVISAWASLEPLLKLEESSSLALEDTQLCAPLPMPRGPIMCIGKNYVEHVKEVDTWKTAPNITEPSIPQHPIVFTKAPQSVVGPGQGIRLLLPHVSSKVDYEAELALIIGKEGWGIPEEEAMDYVFGYTVLNDVTARDVQKLHQQWFLGKSCDTFCPMGPWIVPATELDGTDLSIKCWINDELRQNGGTSQLIFSIPALISTISKAMTLKPGDIIATGTPSGVGSGFNPPRHLKAGDVVKIQIEGVGELLNPVIPSQL